MGKSDAEVNPFDLLKTAFGGTIKEHPERYAAVAFGTDLKNLPRLIDIYCIPRFKVIFEPSKEKAIFANAGKRLQLPVMPKDPKWPSQKPFPTFFLKICLKILRCTPLQPVSLPRRPQLTTIQIGPGISIPRSAWVVSVQDALAETFMPSPLQHLILSYARSPSDNLEFLYANSSSYILEKGDEFTYLSSGCENIIGCDETGKRRVKLILLNDYIIRNTIGFGRRPLDKLIEERNQPRWQALAYSINQAFKFDLMPPQVYLSEISQLKLPLFAWSIADCACLQSYLEPLPNREKLDDDSLQKIIFFSLIMGRFSIDSYRHYRCDDKIKVFLPIVKLGERNLKNTFFQMAQSGIEDFTFSSEITDSIRNAAPDLIHSIFVDFQSLHREVLDKRICYIINENFQDLRNYLLNQTGSLSYRQLCCEMESTALSRGDWFELMRELKI